MARKLLKFIQQQNQPYQKNSSKRSRKDGLHQGLSGNVGRSCDDELHPEVGLHQSEGCDLGQGVATDEVHQHNFGRLSG